MAKGAYPQILKEKLEVSHDKPVCCPTVKERYSSGIPCLHENV